MLLFPQVPSGEGRWRDGLLTHPSSEPLDARYLVIQAPCPHLFNETGKVFSSVCLKICNLCSLVISIRIVFFWARKPRHSVLSRVWMLLFVSSAQSQRTDASTM